MINLIDLVGSKESKLKAEIDLASVVLFLIKMYWYFSYLVCLNDLPSVEKKLCIDLFWRFRKYFGTGSWYVTTNIIIADRSKDI
jgi:hypothetical protein